MHPTPKNSFTIPKTKFNKTVDYKNKKVPDHPLHSKLISLLKILKLFQSMWTFLGTLRTYRKIDLSTHTVNPNIFKKWWKFGKLNQIFHPVNFIKINWHFTTTLKNIPEIHFSKNLKIWAGVPHFPPPNSDYCIHWLFGHQTLPPARPR